LTTVTSRQSKDKQLSKTANDKFSKTRQDKMLIHSYFKDNATVGKSIEQSIEDKNKDKDKDKEHTKTKTKQTALKTKTI
jgi:hypothetical protein